MLANEPTPEHEQVRQAVVESITVGGVTDDLAEVVHRMARKRCSPQLAEDVAQETLLKLVKKIADIDVEQDVYHLVGTIMANVWRQYLRGRRAEYRYIKCLSLEVVRTSPTRVYPKARAKLLATMGRVHRIKYY